MYRNYEGHSIHATAWELLYPVGWEPLIFVTHRGRAKEVTKSFTIGKKFATRQEAEIAGLAFAKSWIDDGKPDPRTMTRQGNHKKPYQLGCELEKSGEVRKARRNV